jgi:hypothetical protein
MNYWISVTSKDHVTASLAGGFMQAPGEKAGPLHQLEQGDIVFFYSPGTLFRRGEVLQAFTGVARVTSELSHQLPGSGGVRPWRRDIAALPSEETSAQPLVQDLAFITDKEHWSAAIGRGLFSIGADDAARLASAMKVDLGR